MFGAVGARGLSCFSFRHLIIRSQTTTPRFALQPSCFSTSTPKKRVGTHNGSFHCDEALACFMIRLADNFSGAEIVRTRDPKVLETLDAVVDVGGDSYVHRLYLSIYKNFVVAVDAVDNGMNQFDSDEPPTYVNNTSLSSRVVRLNLDWTEPDQSSEKENEVFECAMRLAGSEFLESIRFHAKSWLPARSIVEECLASRYQVDASGEIMVMNRSCHWKLHIFDLEKELGMFPPIKYVLYKDDRTENWRIQAVAVSPDDFRSRKPLPVNWRGLENDKLSDVVGIAGCAFVHASGFTGGNRSYEGALEMARASLRA
ncbi:unnamed protein product [Linum trigynum]|uniref:Metal-dependent protein hydrolase n=1 Tax=Linum trigynum TaxID=586398 RepID=A0AAV2G1M7_9ROSI